MKNLKTIIALLVCGAMTSVAFAGNITGTVTYEGDAPARPALTINTTEQHCITLQKVQNRRHSLFQKEKEFRML